MCCRYEDLLTATNGFDEASNRLDRAGSSNSAFAGLLASTPPGIEHSLACRQVAVRSYSWLSHSRAGLDASSAAAMAEIRHPNILPLLGVCAESGHAVYSFMQVASLYSHSFSLSCLIALLCFAVMGHSFGSPEHRTLLCRISRLHAAELMLLSNRGFVPGGASLETPLSLSLCCEPEMLSAEWQLG